MCLYGENGRRIAVNRFDNHMFSSAMAMVVAAAAATMPTQKTRTSTVFYAELKNKNEIQRTILFNSFFFAFFAHRAHQGENAS